MNPSSNPLATWANLLTAIRLASLPSSVVSILYGDWWIAATLFTLAIISDILDGKLARAFDQASPLGGLFDHATDAIFVASCTWALSQLGLINVYLAPAIVIAFSQYMLDSKALSGQPLRASWLGRNNGIGYFVLVGFGIGMHVTGWMWLALPVTAASWLLLASSLVSMGDRALALLRLRE